MKPIFFDSPDAFREWLKNNHTLETELLVGFYKVGTKLPTMTWPESVDQALCFGWIDGVRRSIDEKSYMIRFTPRKASSTWSAINIQKVADLTASGLMHPAGIEAFSKRKDSNSAIYSYENAALEFSSAFKRQFQENEKAWSFFNAQPPGYKKLAIHYVMSAKQEQTRLKRINILVSESEAGRRL